MINLYSVVGKNWLKHITYLKEYFVIALTSVYCCVLDDDF